MGRIIIPIFIKDVFHKVRHILAFGIYIEINARRVLKNKSREVLLIESKDIVQRTNYGKRYRGIIKRVLVFKMITKNKNCWVSNFHKRKRKLVKQLRKLYNQM